MANSNNPKLFYTQPDYSAGDNSGSSASIVHQKPNHALIDDLIPPPPYSPDPNARRSNDSYGSVRSSTEQQHGLLAPEQSPPSPRNQPAKPAWSTRAEYSEIPGDVSSSRIQARRAAGGSGCCKKWHKIVFAALLFWVLIYLFSDKLPTSPSAPIPPPQGCNSNAISWQDLPGNIEFDRNIELVVEGQLSNGQVLVTPLEDRHGGTVESHIEVYPPSLQEQMTFGISQDEGSDTTRLTLRLPERLENDDCISLRTEIRLPYSADRLFIKVGNADVQLRPFVKDVASVEIEAGNGHIIMDSWSGEEIKLITRNGEVKSGGLTADTVYIESSNGLIEISQDVHAKKSIVVKNNNGQVQAFGALQADDTVDVRTSNSLLKLVRVLSDSINVENANGNIEVDYAEAKKRILAKTANAAISMSVAGAKNNQVQVLTSNGEINLHMTSEFEGHFVMSTSHDSVTIEDDYDDIEYQDNLDYIKRGNRRGSGNKGDLLAQTSNAAIHVSFDFE